MQRSVIDEQARIVLTLRVVTVYFFIVFSVVFSIEYYKASFYRGEWCTWPTGVMLLIWFLYYGVPVVLASIFGFLFRPFAKSFRNIFFAILIIQLFFSFILMMLRWDYLRNFKNKNQWKKSDSIKIEKLTPQFYDRNQDGLIEEIKLNGVFDFAKMRPGEYLLDSATVPGGSLSPFVIDGGGTFTITKTGIENKIIKEFTVIARKDLGAVLDKPQNFQVKFLLFRIVSIDEYGKKVLAAARWAPFLRMTDWEGADKEIYADWLLLDSKTDPQVFSMRAAGISKKQ